MSMESDCKMSPERRRLIVATAALGGVGAIALLKPFISSMMPSERAKAAGAPVEADISKLAPGQMITVEWRGKPVWILHRTPEMMAALKKLDPVMADPASKNSEQPEYCKNEHRSVKPEILVAIGICTHLGCSPTSKFKPGSEEGMGADWQGGFLCPCHGSMFDLSGRVYKNMPATDNLPVPPYTYLSDTRILIGEDQKRA
ncbi:MAG: ubiquinol-cytochrome c reductase iron-sulfur subunit [Betaproteobacteria bacterium]|nr:ubiquinol-cytochrome c reductase iron-sulfur subunit [Betaproteobacteria bacterium]